MKNRYKNFLVVLLFLVALFLCAVATAQAQGIGSDGGVLWSTARLTGGALTNTMSSTANTNVYVVPNAVTEVGFQLDLAAQGASTSNTTATVYKSLNGVTYDPTAMFTFTLAANGTTPVVLVTNLTTGPVKYLKVVTATTAIPGAGITNGTLRVFGK